MVETNARQMLEAELQEAERKVAAIKDAIAAYDRIHTPSEQSIQQLVLDVKPNEFQGMNVAKAVEKLLTMLGKPATLQEVLPVLEKGGADLGHEKSRHPRTLKIAVRMNSRPKHALRYEEETENVSLRAWDHKKITALAKLGTN